MIWTTLLPIGFFAWLFLMISRGGIDSYIGSGIGILVLVLVGLSFQIRPKWFKQQFSFELPSIVLWSLGSCLVLVSHWLKIDVLANIGFVLGIYGWLGFILAPQFWQKWMGAALASALVFPIGIGMGSGLGFPVRLLTARFVSLWFEFHSLGSFSAEDIIVLENGIAEVEIPCSGMRGLWVGIVFLVIATTIEKRRFGFKWFLLSVFHSVLLLLANFGRVLALVWISFIWQQPPIADLIHLPLGLLNFTIVCGFTWKCLSLLPKIGESTEPKPIVSGKMAMSLITIVVVLVIIIFPVTSFSGSNQKLLLSLSSLEPLPLTPIEQKFYQDYPDITVQKYHFNQPKISGSILLVATTDWQGHHAPEHCYLGNGFHIDRGEKVHWPQLSAKWLSLNGGKHAATYWFQSKSATTDDFLIRLWQGMTRQQPLWVLNSILLDQEYDPNSPEVAELIQEVYSSIDNSLNGTNQTSSIKEIRSWQP